MTDKEIVERAKEAEKRTGFWELVHNPISKGVNSAFGIGFIEGMVEYRNSLQEESVSEDLEKVAIKYAEKKCYIDYEVYTDNELREAKEKPRFHFYDIAAAFMEGSEWQKEQMMKNATEESKTDNH